MVLGKLQKIKVCPYLKSNTGHCTYTRYNNSIKELDKCPQRKNKSFNRCILLKQSGYYKRMVKENSKLNTMEVKE